MLVFQDKMLRLKDSSSGWETTGSMADKYPCYWMVHLPREGWQNTLLCLSSSYRHPCLGAGKLQGHLAGNWWGRGAFVTHSHLPCSKSPRQYGHSRTLVCPSGYSSLWGFTFSFRTASFTTSVPFGASTSVFPRNWGEKKRVNYDMTATQQKERYKGIKGV